MGCLFEGSTYWDIIMTKKWHVKKSSHYKWVHIRKRALNHIITVTMTTTYDIDQQRKYSVIKHGNDNDDEDNGNSYC